MTPLVVRDATTAAAAACAAVHVLYVLETAATLEVSVYVAADEHR